MTFIPVDFEDAVEPQAAPVGRYQLQIIEAKVVKTGAQSKRPGSPQFRISIGFQDHPEYQNFSQFISLPHEEDDAVAIRFKVLLLKRFCALFNVPLHGDGIDTEELPMEMVGATAEGEVGLSEPNEDTGDVFNNLRVPKLRGEPDDRY
jgi:hypothetical protein